MRRDFLELPPPHSQGPLQYGPNLAALPPPNMLSTKHGLSAHNYFTAKQSPHCFTPVANDQQLATLFSQCPIPSRQLNPNGGPLVRRTGDSFNDEGSNIYTEPTLIEHDVGHTNKSRAISANLISGPPLPPPPPPPIFSASLIEAATTTSSALHDANKAYPFLNEANSVDLRSNCTPVPKIEQDQFDEMQSTCNGIESKGVEFNFSNLVSTSHSPLSEQQVGQPQLTITGQDLEITLSNGEMTQTVLNTSFNSARTSNGHLNPHLLYCYSAQRIEFLPLCDLLFNIISLAAYFCNVVFDSVTAYTLYLNDQILWLLVSLTLIVGSNLVSQSLSYKWYWRERKYRQRIAFEQPSNHEHPTVDLSSPYELKSPTTLALVHILCGGVLWRYFKLFAPVNLATVKREVRDLCVLRMVHGFCEAAPMLLLQVYLVWSKPVDLITDLNIISIFLSLFSLCWALSSFSKNIRQKQIHKLVLTWLGVIFQFFWRVGTITSRIVALTVYATVYQQWIFAVLFLHWFSMLLWLSTPTIGIGGIVDSSESEKKPSWRKRLCQNALVAWVCIFCFINMEDTNPRHRMTAFYSTMFLENVLLLCISIFFDNQPIAPWYRHLVLVLVLGSFLFGIFFMWLYYRFFHIRYLKHTLDAVDTDTTYGASPRTNNLACQADQGLNALEAKAMSHLEAQNSANTKASSPMSRLVNALSNQIFPGLYRSQDIASKVSTSDGHRTRFSNDNIPGVFNCRFNPALKRKKKIPSTVPPLPRAESAILQGDNELTSEMRPVTMGVPKRNQLETINEAMPNVGAMRNLQDPYRRNVIHQIQRPSTNTSILTRQLRQPGADTFWRKSALSARSLSISPSALLKSENTFRLPAKHPFSSTIRTPTSPVNFVPTENFTDKLEFCLDQNQLNATTEQKSKAILRPKPIVQNSIDLDSLDMGQRLTLLNGSEELHDEETLTTVQNNSLLHYYYHPNSRKLKLRTQTPEVLLLPHSDRGRVFYNYPSTVISMPTSALKSEPCPNWKDEFYMQVLNRPTGTEEDDEELFTRQCQRPPVPGREGDDKSEETNDNDNCNYVEGKRSLLNYGMDRSRLEKILEKKVEEKSTDSNNKSQLSKTLPNDTKSKGSTRYLTAPKKKKYSSKHKSRNSKRTNLRSNSQHSLRYTGSNSSSRSSSVSSVSSSGGDGDIESDINQHERAIVGPKSNNTSQRITRADPMSESQNVYDQVQVDEVTLDNSEDIEAYVRNPNRSQIGHTDPRLMQTPQVAPLIIRGPAHQFAASQERASCDAQQIANYHLGSELRNNNLRAKWPPFNQKTTARPKPLYHSAKYKRHNTPL